MAMTFKQPLATFRATHSPAAAAKATITVAAQSSQAPGSTNFNPYMVVQNVMACVAGGTGAVNPVAVNLIDGTSGGTNVAWTGVLAAEILSSGSVAADDLNIPIYSGNVTLEFGSAPGAGSFATVAISGNHINYGDV